MFIVLPNATCKFLDGNGTNPNELERISLPWYCVILEGDVRTAKLPFLIYITWNIFVPSLWRLHIVASVLFLPVWGRGLHPRIALPASRTTNSGWPTPTREGPTPNNKTQKFPKSEISNETTCMNQCDICKKNYYNYSQLGMKSNRLKHFLQEQAACNWRWTCKWFLEDQEGWFERENNSPTIKGKASDMGFKEIRPSMKLHNISFSGK